MKLIICTALLAFVAQRALTASIEKSPKCVCCSALAQDETLNGKVIFPDDSIYDARLAAYYSANAALHPWCMVLPASTADVSKVAQVITKYQCPFGMRSGAHSAFKGSNGVENGITVDLGYLNTTTYDEQTSIASIQPGSNWGNAFTALDAYNVTVAGGRASVVGVGGFTTGGGYSFHSGSHGFACDNVVNYEIVLANGSVVNANSEENSDLWKAQKGSSGNFGFVTRVDMSTIEGPQMWGGFTSYNLTKRDEVFNAYLNFVENMGADEASQTIVALYYDATGFSLRSILTNSKAEVAPPAFDEFVAIENTSSTLRVGSVAELVPEFTGPTPLGLYASWMVGMTTNDFQVMNYTDLALKEYVAKMQAAAPESDFNVLIEFQPVTESIVEHSVANGGNVLGLESVVADGPALMWLIALTVDTAENQEKILPLALEYRDAINAYATEIGANKNWIYLNYAYADQDPISKYGTDHIALIQEVAKQYDPAGVFQSLRHSGFKIPA
ncbi:FAD binding domain-containing protein [Xylariales sp. AK1849]|nr:FAD binding domain-containing protein [Xylariales sp. AK1849]